MSSRRILLVEPAYDTKYPPLGLMKISAYHRHLGDDVTFIRGCNPDAAIDYWDRIYVTTMFCFDWATTVRTVRYYKDNLFGASGRIMVGGIAASILPDKLFAETGIYPTIGCLNRPGMLDADVPLIVDQMVPDYSLLDETRHEYGCRDSYIGYATRGCVRRCRFCAVPTLEPQFVGYSDIKPWVEGIRRAHGERTHLLLLDNNVLASDRLADIVSDIRDLGFDQGAKLNGKMRCVDFNQGLDARLLTKRRMALLSKIPVRPFRLAYDHARSGSSYEKAIRLAAGAGVRTFATYLLYNYLDEPVDLWERLHHNVALSEELDVPISSFPMKYIPITDTDRQHVGPHWNRRFLRSVQCISLVTRGIISARHDFFHKAFGRDPDRFLEILSMPEHYIIDRAKHESDGAAEWRRVYRRLTRTQREQLWQHISVRTRSAIKERRDASPPGRLRDTLSHYVADPS